MPSNTRRVREEQKRKCQEAIDQRRAALKEQGPTRAGISKDPRLKALLAKFRQIQRALAAIGAKEKKIEDLAVRKQEKAEQEKVRKAEKKAKGGKKAEANAEAAAKKPKKEKKEKKQAG